MDGNGCQTKLSLSGVAHLNESVFLLVEEDFHSLNVAVNPWKDMKSQQLKAGNRTNSQVFPRCLVHSKVFTANN